MNKSGDCWEMETVTYNRGSLYWRPVTACKVRVGDMKLRELFRNRKRNLDETDRDYLLGLADGGVDGALDLVEAIKRHGVIELSIE